MSITLLIIFCLASYGITSIISDEYIFHWLRKLLPFKICKYCFATWVGMFLGILLSIFTNYFIISIWVDFLLWGYVSYSSTRIIDVMRFGKEIRIDFDD